MRRYSNFENPHLPVMVFGQCFGFLGGSVIAQVFSLFSSLNDFWT